MNYKPVIQLLIHMNVFSYSNPATTKQFNIKKLGAQLCYL